ncbi:unnamed protein product [Dicrocoelium dendriticum]|nr:unnamed protein product [Dicrocoelium dendriticum]
MQSSEGSDHEELIQICLNTSIPDAISWNVEQDCFLDNHIDGKKLVNVHASTLSMMGVKNFADIQKITTEIRGLLNLEEPNNKRTIRLPPRNFLGMYLETQSYNGCSLQDLSFPRFVFHTVDKVWKPPLGNEGIVFDYHS